MNEEEIKKMLKRNLEVSEETLKVLKKVHRAQVFGRFVKTLKWLLVIAAALGAYYYIQPFLKTFWQTLADIKQDFSAFRETGKDLKESSSVVFDLQEFFEKR